MDAVTNLINQSQGAITALATAVIAVMAVVTAVLTWGLIRENRLIRKAGTTPEIVAYLSLDSQYKNIVNFVLANIGQGAAKNVKFEFGAEHMDFEAHKVRIGNSGRRMPISVLPPGEKIEAFFGLGHELFQPERLKPFEVSINYEDLLGKRLNDSYVLDVSQFDGLASVGKPTDREIAETLKKIERYIHQWSSGIKRIKVETISASQARREEEQSR